MVPGPLKGHGMSGNWAWEQAVHTSKFPASFALTIEHQDKIGEDGTTHGAMFVPVVLGSDKTTVSIATRQNDFYPLYASLGNVHNSI
jgi:hypothetical protein